MLILLFFYFLVVKEEACNSAGNKYGYRNSKSYPQSRARRLLGLFPFAVNTISVLINVVGLAVGICYGVFCAAVCANGGFCSVLFAGGVIVGSVFSIAVSGSGDRFNICGVTNGAGYCLFTFGLATGFFGNGTFVPSMARGRNCKSGVFAANGAGYVL